jgi:hypothetical protein
VNAVADFTRPTAQSVANSAGYPRATAEQAERAKTESPPALRVWTIEEIWKPLEPPDYLVEGLFVSGSLALIVAYGASLKTWALEDVALSVATGADWLHRFPTKKAEALLIDFESGDYELRRRAHRIARGRAFAVPIHGFAFVTMPALSLANEEFFVELRPLAKKYRFIGIDSLAAGSGGIDENDARFATSLQRLKAIAAETGCVIVVLHHSRKGGGEDADPREMVRGSSAIFNACDVVLQMTRGKDDAFVVRQTKARGGKSVEPFLVRVEDTSSDGSIVIARDVQGADGEDSGALSNAIAKCKRQLLTVLASERDLRTKEAVYGRLNGTKAARIAALRELTESELVMSHEGRFRLVSEVRQ